MSNINVLELFSGIGAASKALSNLSIPHTIVDAVEIDKYAIASFNAIHGTSFSPQDITKWGKTPSVPIDLLMHGSPCQSFSIAGLQAGGDKGSGTESSLMYESIRIISKLLPSYVVWENVKNLLSPKHRHNFDAYLEALSGLGYTNYYKIMNAKDYGIPQNRERVFTVSIRTDVPYSQLFEFPAPIPLVYSLSDFLEKTPDEKYYLTDEQIVSLASSSFDQNKRYYDPEGLCPTLSTMQGGQRQPKIIEDFYKSRPAREYSEVAPTLRANRFGLKLDTGKRVRRLTPRECWRLMGFSDIDFGKARNQKPKKMSDQQLYKQAGNSIVVPCLEAIFRKLFLGVDNKCKRRKYGEDSSAV